MMKEKQGHRPSQCCVGIRIFNMLFICDNLRENITKIPLYLLFNYVVYNSKLYLRNLETEGK